MAVVLQFIRLACATAALGVATLCVLALFGFAVPILDLLNHGQIFLFPGSIVAIIVLAVCLRGQWRGFAVIYAFVGLAASANVMVPELLRSWMPRPEASSATITIMTHNVFGQNHDMGAVTKAIMEDKPDIIVLQEYFGGQANDLSPLIAADYPYSVRCRGGKRANLGLYSRLPFAQVEDNACPDDAYGITRTAHILAKVQAPNGKTFSVITTHMDWPYPIERQREQLVALSEVLDKIEGPLTLAGDFNSTPWSYALRGFVDRNNLVRETVNLITFPVSWFYGRAWRGTIPFLPLDHMMTRGGIVVHDVHTGLPTGSDHLPVVVRFTVE